jgi:hypothetical protein
MSTGINVHRFSAWPFVIAIVMLWTLLPGTAAAVDTEAPFLVSLTREAPLTLNVITPPAAPTVRLEISDNARGLGWFYVYWISPSGHTVNCSDYSEQPIKTGFVSCRGRWPGGAGFNIYHEPGTWTIYLVWLCDRASNCRAYSGAELDAITPAAEREYTVVNNRSPDTTPPGGSNGVILTPSVPLAGTYRYVRVRMTLTDDISGAVQASVRFRSPSGTQYFYVYAAAAVPALNAKQFFELDLDDSTTWETGTWTIDYIQIYDLVGNGRFYSTEAQLDARFPGGRTLEVTP